MGGLEERLTHRILMLEDRRETVPGLRDRLEDEGSHGSGVLRGNHFHRLLGCLTVERHAGGALRVRRCAESVQCKEMAHSRQRAQWLAFA